MAGWGSIGRGMEQFRRFPIIPRFIWLFLYSASLRSDGGTPPTLALRAKRLLNGRDVHRSAEMNLNKIFWAGLAGGGTKGPFWRKIIFSFTSDSLVVFSKWTTSQCRPKKRKKERGNTASCEHISTVVLTTRAKRNFFRLLGR